MGRSRLLPRLRGCVAQAEQRSLLIEQFELKTHLEMREQTVYVMTRARPDGPPGPGMKPRPECAKADPPCVSVFSAIPPAGRLSLSAATIDLLASGGVFGSKPVEVLVIDALQRPTAN